MENSSVKISTHHACENLKEGAGVQCSNLLCTLPIEQTLQENRIMSIKDSRFKMEIVLTYIYPLLL